MSEPGFMSRSAVVDGIAWAGLGISSFGLFATVFENYVFSETAGTRWLTSPGASVFNDSVNMVWAFYMAVFRPLFPAKLFLVVPALDAYGMTYFLLSLFSLAIIWRHLGLRRALMRCSLVAWALLFLYEIGLSLVSTAYLDMHVTNIQTFLGLAWFSNEDLLALSGVISSALVLGKASRVLTKHLV